MDTGRIGRIAHRVILEKHSQEIDIVAINAGSSTDIKGWMYLLSMILHMVRFPLLSS